jgi:inorganic triphosphatase YgiF
MSTARDAFLVRAREKIESLTREVMLLEAQEEGVRRRKIALQQAITDWERSVSIYSEAMQITPDDAPGQLDAALDVPQGSLAQLSELFLEQRGGPGKITDVVRWLVSIGRLSGEPTKAGQNYGQVYTTLLRHPERFVKVGRGEFRLAHAASGGD